MKEGKQKVVGIHGDPQNNKRPRDKKRNSSDNKDEYNELLKYKQSFYIIRKTVNLIKNHYSNKINKADTLRERERKHLSHLKRENVILEDKCTFYAEHVEELKKIYTEQIKLKNNKIESLQDELDKMRKVTEVGDESNNTRILKLREDQIERLSQQLDSINGLYYKQVDSNKKLMKEIEELNKSILYLNNKIQEEKNNRDNVRRRLKYYKRYTKNKKRFKLNFDMMVDEEDSGRTNEEEDICVSVLCHLKTELDMIDEENKKKEEKRGVNHGDNNWNRNSNNDVKFENKKVLSSPVKNLKKKNDGNIVFHKDMKENIQNREAKRDMSRKDNNGSSNGHGGFIKHNGMDPKKGNNWNPLTLNDIYFYSNFDDNFDNKCDYFDQDTPSSGRPSVGEAKESAHCLDGEVKESKRIDEGTERTSLKTADGTPHGCTPQKTNSTVEHFPAGV
ncbi:Uncharacterized protein PKNOH_S140283900 [Plasmodium knowlesi]|uniref:Uncharacterized protein n=1 Tax=Plasmodium knowlesi TaxID=5850 RepID=A0A1Y3DKR7_PLAKN|nr:Uncharacterized protein PKNOH_S140283900 [Plasmodium knowlesi]|eukprot:XP_002262528.1 hypothetical protein, conserved in Plasmodium species [Plasmodium knowlesi strain H]